MKRMLAVVLTLVFVSVGIGAQAQDKVVKKIIEIGQTDNRTMDHDDFLCNTIGGRLIGSAALTEAEAWVKEQYESWGLEVMVQEVGEINVGFNRGPWWGRMLSEDGMQLHFGTPSYTAGTKGAQKGHVLIEPKSLRDLERMKGRLKGAWVLIDGPVGALAVDMTRDTVVTDGYKMIDNKPVPTKDTAVHFYPQMVEAGVLGFIHSAPVPIQILYDRKNCYDLTMETLPKACDIRLDERQFKIIYEKARNKEDFQLEFQIRNHFYRGPVKYHNIIGMIRGSKYPDQYVLAGGHLDAYDGGTGAVDDGNGTAVTMEAARLLAMSGAKPKRTLMFCVWTGEEFGLLGSKYFVENKTVPLDKISNYFNRDGGPLCATSIIVPEAMYKDFEKIAEPLENMNPEFPFKVEKRTDEPRPRPTRAGGSDHAYFAMNGVPTISPRETDPKGYNFDYREIWHTESDIWNKVIPEYMEHSSVVTAVLMYGLSNLDHLLSRDGLYKEGE